MKARLFLFLISVTLLIACGGEKKFEGEVVFETIEIVKDGTEIDPDTTKTYQAEVGYYCPVDAPAYLKDSINKQTKIFLSNWFDIPAAGECNIEQTVVDDMRDFYKQIDEIDDKDCATCRIKQIDISAEDIFQNKDLISVAYNWYIYEGGAHGNYGKICYNFEKATGKKINYSALVKDENGLLNVALKKFKEQHGVAEGEEISSMFYFDNNKFHLTDNFNFTESGLMFYYNPYEIAPYAAGLIELLLPYDELKGLVNYLDNVQQ